MDSDGVNRFKQAAGPVLRDKDSFEAFMRDFECGFSRDMRPKAIREPDHVFCSLNEAVSGGASSPSLGLVGEDHKASLQFWTRGLRNVVERWPEMSLKFPELEQFEPAK